MPDLRIRIKKKTDGNAALSCIRADGSTTWQRQEGRQGQFFPFHDLTHLAVESVLGFDHSFYGLIAGGLDISAFGEDEARATIPAEAVLTELIVGYFDVERACGEIQQADEFNARMRAYRTQHDLAPPPFVLTDDQLERVREVLADLFARWRALPPGDTLELPFDRRSSAAVQPARAAQ